MTTPSLYGIYAILDADTYAGALDRAATDLLGGGIRLLQYRAKSGVDIELVRHLHMLTRAIDAVLIVNDNYAAAIHADGIHIGQDDIDYDALAEYQAHKPAAIIGVSAHSPQHIAAAPYASYFGIGPLRRTASKTVAREPLGIDGIAELAQLTAKPVCAIGGIAAHDLPELVSRGIAMAACIGAFAHADRRNVAAEFIRIWHERPR